MATLWADGWFYISALGFCASLTLFFYLLGLYRHAVESSDESFVLAADEPTPTPQPADTLQVPGVTPILAPAAEKKETMATLPLPAAVPEGVSLQDIQQDIKSETEHFDREIFELRDMVARQAAQGEIILKRLMDLSESVKASAAAPVRVEPAVREAAAFVPIQRAPLPEPAPVEKVPVPAPMPASMPVELHLESVAPQSAPSPQAVPPAAAQEPAAEPRRKGPVWPV